MGTHEDTVDTLERELDAIEETYRNLTDDDWQRPTRLQPLDASLTPWTIFGVRAASGRAEHDDPRLPLIG